MTVAHPPYNPGQYPGQYPVQPQYGGYPGSWQMPAPVNPNHEPKSHNKLIAGLAIGAVSVAAVVGGALGFNMIKPGKSGDTTSEGAKHSPEVLAVAPDPTTTDNEIFSQSDPDAQVRALAAIVDKQIEAKGKEYTDALSTLGTYTVQGRIKPAEVTDTPADVLSHMSAVAYMYSHEENPKLRENMIAMNYPSGSPLFNQELKTINDPKSNGIPSTLYPSRPTPIITQGSVNGIEANGIPTFGVIVSDMQYGSTSSDVIQLRGDDPTTKEIEPSSWVVTQSIDYGQSDYQDPPVVSSQAQR